MDKDDEKRIVAAVDLGSNSFHMIVARLEEEGTLSIIDKLREPVRLGEGLKGNGKLSREVTDRALACLERFGQRIRNLPHGDVRVVGTNTLRVATNAEKFVAEAQRLLGHSIEIVSGREEARLIYLGVAHGRAAREGRRLVVDIGGGSTELIIGEGGDSLLRESLYTGCVSTSKEFFDGGEITEKRMKAAILNASLAIHPVAQDFRAGKGRWEEAVGCSGTIKAIRNIAQAEGWCDTGITLKSLYQMRNRLIKQGHVDRLRLESLKEDRSPVLPGGLAVLIAVFETLGIKQMRVSGQALREGLLYDLVGRIQHRDARDATVDSVVRRWNLDVGHADNVMRTSLLLFAQVEKDWKLIEENRQLLKWAAQLHEIGLQISHGAYHKHGAYILMHADLPGFSRTEQALLATLVLNHRQKIRLNSFDELVSRAQKPGLRLCILLRLAVLFHRGRTDEQVPDVSMELDREKIILTFPERWLEQHSLTDADLQKEARYIEAAGLSLDYR
ncbi:exopolyphosphatase/guanosine-5'-triphosphate,3'-diphosphate pyrophosphatase [Thiogranum longum]|uniref:Exopolyphosphatase n=1 Tax=Thiogranum longum TaxID=1537524 RepID=A0A4R1H7M3_9GAMM|nr:exopolyphosphatase [Thiogranum longum]TCK17827.1 exopolyphosphatase/guanosine-5'-triphosphate,3'-diphosphate pyrophosphatase [Thiogranum longum]